MVRSATFAAALMLGRPGSAQTVAVGAAKALNPAQFPVVEKTLSNGLKVRLLRDATVPTITYYTYFKVGSRNDRIVLREQYRGWKP